MNDGGRLLLSGLTVITTIFMPLTFVAGIYGMNFDYMPELHWRLGYAWALLLMVSATIGMPTYFKWRGWMMGNNGELSD